MLTIVIITIGLTIAYFRTNNKTGFILYGLGLGIGELIYLILLN